nr:hypothetical protein [Streptomyces sp. LBUM 1481]
MEPPGGDALPSLTAGCARGPGQAGRGRLPVHRRPQEGPHHPRRLQRLPREIEEVLHEHPAVALAAVVGLPDEHLGEEVAAAVVLRPGADATVEELQEFVRERVAAYKYPRRVWLADALPMGPSGKILKREITTRCPDLHLLRVLCPAPVGVVATGTDHDLGSGAGRTWDAAEVREPA